MSAVERFYLQPTPYSPNNPLPIVLYRNVLPQPYAEESATKFLENNEWQKRGAWGFTFQHHFHPNTHECYGIIRGSTTLCLGRGRNDTTGGIHVPLKAGDVIVVPAGTTHTSLESEGDYWFVGVYPKVLKYPPGIHISCNTHVVASYFIENTLKRASERTSSYLLAYSPVSQDAPKWRNEFGKKPLDHAALRREISAVAMPTTDPVYGPKGPLVSLWAKEVMAQSDIKGLWGERVAGAKL